jgi:hypothetical protein
MQTQVATFTASGNPPAGAGTPVISIANTAVVQP